MSLIQGHRKLRLAVYREHVMWFPWTEVGGICRSPFTYLTISNFHLMTHGVTSAQTNSRMFMELPSNGESETWCWQATECYQTICIYAYQAKHCSNDQRMKAVCIGIYLRSLSLKLAKPCKCFEQLLFLHFSRIIKEILCNSRGIEGTIILHGNTQLQHSVLSFTWWQFSILFNRLYGSPLLY